MLLGSIVSILVLARDAFEEFLGELAEVALECGDGVDLFGMSFRRGAGSLGRLGLNGPQQSEFGQGRDERRRLVLVFAALALSPTVLGVLKLVALPLCFVEGIDQPAQDGDSGGVLATDRGGRFTGEHGPGGVARGPVEALMGVVKQAGFLELLR